MTRAAEKLATEVSVCPSCACGKGWVVGCRLFSVVQKGVADHHSQNNLLLTHSSSIATKLLKYDSWTSCHCVPCVIFG